MAFEKETVEALENIKKSTEGVHDVLLEIKDGKAKPGAAAAEEKADQDAKDTAMHHLLKSMAGSLTLLNKTMSDWAGKFLTTLSEDMGLGIIAALVVAPIAVLIGFFKGLSDQIRFIKFISGKPGWVGKLFSPMTKFFDWLADVGKALVKPFKAMARWTGGAAAGGGPAAAARGPLSGIMNVFRKIGSIFSWLKDKGKIFIDYSKTGSKILSWAQTVGKLLGKLFLPITLLMGAFDLVTGFIDGFTEEREEGGSVISSLLAGLEGGLSKLFVNLIGMPLDFLKLAVAWVLEKFGFDEESEAVKSLDFKGMVADIIAFPFNMIRAIGDWIGLLFADPVEALKELWTGIVGEGGLLDILWAPLDLAINWIMGLFGWSMPSVGGGPEGEPFSMRTLVLSAFNKAKDWVMGLFSFDEGLAAGAAGILDATVLFIPNMVAKGVLAVGNWLLGLFGFDAASEKLANPEDFSIGDLITKAVGSIFEFFKNLLDIDVMSVVKKIPGAEKMLGVLGFGGTTAETIEEHGQTLKGAIKAGLYDHDIAGASEINKQALEEGVESGLVQKEMLQAIIDDKDLRDEDLEFMKTLVERATKPGSLFVHDAGMHERLDKLMQPLMGTNGLQSGPALAYAPQTQVSNQTHQHNAKRIIHPISDLVRTQAWEAM